MKEFIYQSIFYISIAHLMFYAYLEFWAKLVKIGTVNNKKDNILKSLRKQYPNINIKIYKEKKGVNRWGINNGKNIYLNERLLGHEKPLRHTFIHELYHLEHKHSLKMLGLRILLSLSPCLYYVTNWWIALIIYVAIVNLIPLVENYLENKTDKHTNAIIPRFKNKNIPN